MDFRRILAVGDVHGEIEMLRALWERIAFDDARDMLVFLGDYIDRGAAPAAVLSFIKEQTERYEHVHALRGNHEAMMLAYLEMHTLDEPYVPDGSMSSGADVTLAGLAQLPHRQAEELVAFAAGLPLSHRMTYAGQEIVFVHAGLHPDKEISEERDMLWIRRPFYERYRGNALVVVGHTPTQALGERRDPHRNTPILCPNNIIACDTGGFLPHGRISCVDVRRCIDLRKKGNLSPTDWASCYIQSPPNTRRLR